MTTATPFGWLQIVRLGLIQACLGAVVVMTTSTLNRVMVVELALPALLPGFLVGLHYAVQIVRPRLGYGADRGKRSGHGLLRPGAGHASARGIAAQRSRPGDSGFGRNPCSEFHEDCALR